jgi:pyruvate carboxylase subunit B
MKMENEIPAPVDGTVKKITVKVGDNVSTDETLMVIE